jgi:hypothetical protein
MDEKIRKQSKWLIAGFIIILLIAGSATVLLTNTNFAGKSSLGSMDPQTGIQKWIDAVNARDYHRLYSLSPDFIRTQIDEPGFIRAQDGNPLFAGENRIAGFQVLNQTVSGNNVMIATVVELDIAGEGSGNVSRNIALFLKFTETFEHGEWKVWTV